LTFKEAADQKKIFFFRKKFKTELANISTLGTYSSFVSSSSVATFDLLFGRAFCGQKIL
jgi:hypothetical protein